MKNFSQILSLAVFVLFCVGTVVALGEIIGHPARYIEQHQRLGTS